MVTLKQISVNFEEKKPAQSWNKASFADDVVQNCHHILKDITSSSGKNLNEVSDIKKIIKLN